MDSLSAHPHFGPFRLRQGFTMVEIVAVLVVLGILFTVVVAKYYDLQREAEVKALLGVKNEAQARVMHLFGLALLAGKTLDHPAFSTASRCEKTWLSAVDDFNMAPGNYEQADSNGAVGDIRVWLYPLADNNYKVLRPDFWLNGKPVLPEEINIRKDPWLIHSPCQ